MQNPTLHRRGIFRCRAFCSGFYFPWGWLFLALLHLEQSYYTTTQRGARGRISRGYRIWECADLLRDLSVGLPYRDTKPAERSAETAEVAAEVLRLFDESHGRLLRYAISLGLSVDDGEEIVQEVFLSLFKHLQLGKSRANLGGWLFRVTHNLALKKRGCNQRLKVLEVDGDGEAVEQRLDPGPNPEEQLTSNQRSERLRAVWRALPSRDQECLYLRSEGLRYREIARALGISLGSVSASLVRSLQRLSQVDREKP